MRKIKNCPLCGVKMETTDYQHYFHPDNDCILHGFVIDTNARRSVESWNTRKPMERIVERLEVRKGTVVIDGKAMYQEDYFIDIDEAIEIVKQEGGLNERDS